MEKIAIDVILWDFDGVIIDSDSVREKGFRDTLKLYSSKDVGELIDYHKRNGGLSRYVKFRYFFEEILKKTITEKEIADLAETFSVIMKDYLVDEKLLIPDSTNYIRKEYKKTPMYIISGSDQKELRFLCKELKISHYFEGIFGSPTPKNDLVRDLKSRLDSDLRIALIGDSTNDLEAAMVNGIQFFGYNNSALREYTSDNIGYIDLFQ